MSDPNGDLDRRLYKYPGTDVLRNKLGIKDPAALEAAERDFVRERIEQGSPTGNFDLDHLRAIHHHLFQDVYEWAGEIRQVDFHKTDWFHPVDRIATGMADVHRRLVARSYLFATSPKDFAERAAVIMGDVNYCHPFREGNGRTQMQYFEQLAARAGHKIDLTKFTRETWIAASVAANRADYSKMQACISAGLVRPTQEKTGPRQRRPRQRQ